MGRRGGPGAWLLLSLPSLAIASVIIAVLVGLQERPVAVARLYGGPTVGQEVFHGRLYLEEELATVTRPLGGETVRVAWAGEHSEHEVLVTTGEDGFAEFSLTRPNELGLGELSTKIHFRVSQPKSGLVLLDGQPELSVHRWREAAKHRGGTLHGSIRGPTLFDVRVREGVLAAPFSAHLELRLLEGVRSSGLSLSISAEGATVLSPSHVELGTEREVELLLAPTEHAASLTIEATTPSGEKSLYFAGLPVVPGALFPRVEKDSVRVLSPLPRSSAWYSVVTHDERLEGGRILLESLPNGTSTGTLPPLAPASKPRFLVLSSEGDGRSPSTVGYPLDEPGATFDVLDGFLQDGGDEARLREASRQRHLRFLLSVHVGLVFLLTLGLFFLRVRKASSRMVEDLSQAGLELPEAPAGGYFGLAALCLTLGFSAAIVWVSLGALP